MATAIPAAITHEFDDIVATHVGRLFGIAFTILRDRRDAEDAVQETMVIAWKGWAKTSGHPDPRPWLNKICVNHCLSRRPRLGRLRARSQPLYPSLVAKTEEPVDPQLVAGFQRLSRQQRAVVLLHYQMGYSLNECAELMECRPGTVRSHLSRALSALREEMQSD